MQVGDGNAQYNYFIGLAQADQVAVRKAARKLAEKPIPEDIETDHLVHPQARAFLPTVIGPRRYDHGSCRWLPGSSSAG
jgi:hypothetical protein